MAAHPRPLPQPPTSARLQPSRPITSDVTNKNEPNPVVTSKPTTPSAVNSGPKTGAQQSQNGLGMSKDLMNSGLGRVIASPAVQRQLFADQTFSNKDGYKRTAVAVNSGSTGTNDSSAERTSDTEVSNNKSSITMGIAHSNKANSGRPLTPKSSIPRPGTAKNQSQANALITDGTHVQQTSSVVKLTKHATPLSKGSIKTGRSFILNHKNIKPPPAPHKDPMLKVRNLNYTPGRPYSEVSEPGSPPSERVTCSGVNSSCGSPQPSDRNRKLMSNSMYSSYCNYQLAYMFIDFISVTVMFVYWWLFCVHYIWFIALHLFIDIKFVKLVFVIRELLL